MWIANQWKDYEIIDTSKGEKLERWGDYLLVRPTTGHLGHPKNTQRLEENERSLPPQQKRRRRMGVF